MRNSLPMRPPFQSRLERQLVWSFIISCLFIAICVGSFALTNQQLIQRIPPTETNPAFLSREIYEKTADLDVVFLGNCTIWWHVHTPTVQEDLSKIWGRPANVITLGYNHFGSDVQYLLAHDLLERRKVKYLVLSLPKIRDFNDFPHRGAVNWWIYPRNWNSSASLSISSHVKLAGITLFTSFRRLFFALHSPTRVLGEMDSLGFRSERRASDDISELLPLISDGQDEIIESLGESQRDRAEVWSEDWLVYFSELSKLAKARGTTIIFIDSPHGPEFESDEETVAWGFEPLFPADTKMIRFNFRNWYERQPEEIKRRLYLGDNLTGDGARFYTRMLVPALSRVVTP